MKINMVIACLLGTALALGGCASTPQSEAYLSTPIGDGSESGFVMTTTLPDGTTHEMHLFSTNDEVREFLEKTCGFDKTWHSKELYTNAQLIQMNSKTADLNLSGLVMKPYSFDEVGEIGRVMKEKGLRFAMDAQRGTATEYVEFGITAMDKKYTIFRYSIYLVSNEEMIPTSERSGSESYFGY